MHYTKIHNMIYGGLRCKYYCTYRSSANRTLKYCKRIWYNIRFAHSDHSTSLTNVGLISSV